MRARTKQPGDEGSLKGMEIALTIDWMVRSKADPERDLDDWCYTENSRENFEKLMSLLPAIAGAVGRPVAAPV